MQLRQHNWVKQRAGNGLLRMFRVSHFFIIEAVIAGNTNEIQQRILNKFLFFLHTEQK